MSGHGWQAGFADPDAPGGQPELAFDRPTLLVVDGADLNVDLIEKLVRALGYWPVDAPPVRLLLLARHIPGWWATLTRRTNRLAAELADPPLSLHTGDLPAIERSTHYAAAIAAFTPHIGGPSPAVGPGRGTGPDLADAAFANPLLVHMRALLGVSGADLPATGAALRERTLAGVLDEELND